MRSPAFLSGQMTSTWWPTASIACWKTKISYSSVNSPVSIRIFLPDIAFSSRGSAATIAAHGVPVQATAEIRAARSIAGGRAGPRPRVDGAVVARATAPPDLGEAGAAHQDAGGLPPFLADADLVTHSGEQPAGIRRQRIWLDEHLARQPLMVDARRIDRLLDRHRVLDDVEDRLQRDGDDA